MLNVNWLNGKRTLGLLSDGVTCVAKHITNGGESVVIVIGALSDENGKTEFVADTDEYYANGEEWPAVYGPKRNRMVSALRRNGLI